MKKIPFLFLTVFCGLIGPAYAAGPVVIRYGVTGSSLEGGLGLPVHYLQRYMEGVYSTNRPRRREVTVRLNAMMPTLEGTGGYSCRETCPTRVQVTLREAAAPGLVLSEDVTHAKLKFESMSISLKQGRGMRLTAKIKPGYTGRPDSNFSWAEYVESRKPLTLGQKLVRYFTPPRRYQAPPATPVCGRTPQYLVKATVTELSMSRALRGAIGEPVGLASYFNRHLFEALAAAGLRRIK